jgi:uncharacterized surface protein with fasciclin (FAS1) repeats
MELPSLTTLRHILDRLKANDIAWFKDQWKSGSFGWMKDRLPAGEYDQIGSRVEAGDLSPLKSGLSKIDLPGIDLFKGLGAAGAAAGAAGVAGAAKVAGSAASATKMAGSATSAVKTTVDDKKKKGLLWILPAIAAVGLLGFGLTQCGGSKDAGVADTSVVVEETVAATETTIAATPETVAVETTIAAVETTVAAAVETTIAATATETSAVAAGAAEDILAVAGKAGSFKTLSAAVGAAGLTETLQGSGPFTVFAPTDDAFAKLPAGLVDALLKPENKEALTKVLTYHVVAGKVLAADVKAGDVPSVEGSALKVTTEGGVKINDANVTATDIAASNGVIHVIDSVLVPPSIDAAALLGGAAAPTETTVAAAAAPAAPENLTVYFGNASSKLDAEAQSKIAGAIETLKKLPAGSKVSIVGHASKTGNSEQNEKLSLARANNVKDALIEGLGGVAASNVKFDVEFRGDSQPDEDETKSRKVTIEIQP